MAPNADQYATSSKAHLLQANLAHQAHVITSHLAAGERRGCTRNRSARSAGQTAGVAHEEAVSIKKALARHFLGAAG